MPIDDSIKIYQGVVTSSFGSMTADELLYHYWARDVSNPDSYIKSTQPAKPRRPFSGNIEIEEALPPGAAILVIEQKANRTLILIDQEKYATTECQ
jgi:hypothetical protein